MCLCTQQIKIVIFCQRTTTLSQTIYHFSRFQVDVAVGKRKITMKASWTFNSLAVSESENCDEWKSWKGKNGLDVGEQLAWNYMIPLIVITQPTFI